MLGRTRENLRCGRLHASGDQWPIFLYQDCRYNPDDPWNGLLRGAIIVSVSHNLASVGIYSSLLRRGI